MKTLIQPKKKKKQSNLFGEIDLFSQKQVIDTIVQAFQQGRKSKRAQALSILGQLFEHFSFNLTGFFRRFRLSAVEIDTFLSQMLYSIYYQRFIIAAIPSAKSAEFLMNSFLVMLAENLKEPRLKKILASLLLREKLQLISYCAFNRREGDWFVLKALEESLQQTSDLFKLIKGLKSNYYNPELLETLVEGNTTLKEVLRALYEEAKREIKEINRLLPPLITLMIEAPIKGIDEISNFQRRLDPETPLLEDPSIRAAALQAQEKFIQNFKQYQNKTYRFNELESFFRCFGLRGQLLDKARGSLLDIFKNLNDFFQNPHLIPPQFLEMSYNLILNLCQQLDKYTNAPAIYAKGVEELIFSLPTRGRDLERGIWLSSVLTGLTQMIQYFDDRGVSGYQLSQFPLIIFDQGAPKEFKDNEIYLRKIAKLQGALIWHLSRSQTLQLADKLGVRPWIEVDPDQWYFGYEGARNCVFFLAPVIHRAIKAGVKSFEELLASPLDMEGSVFGKGEPDGILLVSEDDMVIPFGNLFAYAAFAVSHHHRYFRRMTPYIGRITWNYNSFIDFETIAKDPASVFFMLGWTNHGIASGTLSKPRFSFPMMLNCEEWNVSSIDLFYDYFQQPQTHLGGTRFPKKLFPSSPHDGLAEFLESYLPYNLMFLMVDALIDQSNSRGCCIFPWNDAAMFGKFQHLGELMSYALSPAVKMDLQSRFWRNLEKLFLEKVPLPLGQVLSKLQEPVGNIPENLKDTFQKFQKEAQIFMHFGKLVTQYHQSQANEFLQQAKNEVERDFQVRLDETLLAKTLYRLIVSVCNWSQVCV